MGLRALLLTTVVFASPTDLIAQVGGGVAGGISIPTGDYGDDSGNDAGLATIGFTVLARMQIGIPTVPGLAWTASAGVTSHGVDDALADGLVDLGGEDVEVGRYLGIPLMTGLKFSVPINEAASVYGTGEMGIFLAKGPTIEASGEEAEYRWASKFGFALGGGIQLSRRFGLGFRYVPLGDVESDIMFDDGSNLDVEGPVSYLDIVAEVTLW